MRGYSILLAMREALQKGVAFQEAVAAHPDVRRHLTARQIAAALDYKNSLGLAGYFVDRVLTLYERTKGKPPARKRTK